MRLEEKITIFLGHHREAAMCVLCLLDRLSIEEGRYPDLSNLRTVNSTIFRMRSLGRHWGCCAGCGQ
jgi:hypothetical protein